MQSVRSKLAGIDETLSKWKEDKTSGEVYHELIKSELSRILNDKEFPGHLKLKLKELTWHINAMLGIEDDNGHGFEQHWVWAYGVLMATRM
ncbi:hypothetical protein [Pseudoalteromonas sp. MMG005]|uniref:hypothetical protein n=1 Tax=Pseudoalteromonas sp. MMG005 TaxID=2822682 RepID=UPI001B3A4569|nr:hypothetical protein [Pseudoalteromonas sp. MMG005]MBQ4848340.1 hypothetical protein [Pseudoalteromonas sp. MMG005]